MYLCVILVKIWGSDCYNPFYHNGDLWDEEVGVGLWQIRRHGGVQARGGRVV